MNVVLVVLAAGASERLGTCKALVDLGGRSPLERLLDAGADLAERVVVTGADDARIARRLPPGVARVYHPGWARGRSGSVAAAAAARPDRDLLLAPVDVPLVPREVFQALARAWRAAGCPPRGWLAPTPAGPGAPAGSPAARGPFGHPVVLGRDLARELASFAPDRPLRELRAAASPIMGIRVEGREVLDDLDTREDLEDLRRRLVGSPTRDAPRQP